MNNKCMIPHYWISILPYYIWKRIKKIILRRRRRRKYRGVIAPKENITYLMRISAVWLSFSLGTWLLSAISIHHSCICLSNYRHKSKEEEQFTLPVIWFASMLIHSFVCVYVLWQNTIVVLLQAELKEERIFKKMNLTRWAKKRARDHIQYASHVDKRSVNTILS